ncbi:uncharacterized protein LOC112502220 [Cynara cardunculus var. scolymus]|uniref:uncharacterized protein LOC112502220 n=1 Tax=Cynara cardunculus var. scolymus TaxID=59895 RepID=UPI000D623F91|nr:uncharacterized protein LOC112502220 [Cynara cardunculus var. scolymus]
MYKSNESQMLQTLDNVLCYLLLLPVVLEIGRFVKDTRLNPEDMPDILCRLFKIKLDALIKKLKDNELFGKIQAGFFNQYFFKYINKGPDRATVAIVENNNDVVTINVVDEIKKYYDCRHVSACEASWRTFGYDVHYRTPSVLRLPFHLSRQQQVVFGAEDDIENVINRPSVASSMFLAWMNCNQIYQEARELTYVELPTKFVWKLEERRWDRRKKGFTIGRIHSVSPTLREAYYLRILLNKVKCPKSFEDIRTVNGNIFPTFRDACYALGVLDDDMEFIDAIEEANLTASDLSLNEEQKLVTALTNEQRGVYDEIMTVVEKNKGGVFFVYGHGGTGKTFIWKTLAASIRSKGEIILNVASSGIASLLLTSGRTAHCRFQIPLIINEDSLCHIKPDSDVAKLIKKTTLIIWDEAPMVHKHAFEALDRSLNDIFNNRCISDSQMLFGGKVFVFGGDFRQILPVIPNASRQYIVNASLSSSYIWEKCKVLRLTKNMRLTANSECSKIEQTRVFAT